MRHLLLIAILLSSLGASAGDFPPDAISLLKEATTAFKKKDYSRAEQIYSELAIKYPDNWMVRANLGAIRIELGKLKEAEADYLRAMAAKPDDPFILSSLGILYTRMSEWDKARSIFNATLKLQPNDQLAKEYLDVITEQMNGKPKGDFYTPQEQQRFPGK